MARAATTKNDPWKEWLQTHGPRLLLYARQQARSEADAHDILQNALVKTWKAIGPSPSADHSLPLAFTNVRRCAIDLGRATDRRASREQRAALDANDATWFSSSLDQRERAQEIQEALETISPSHREVITLKIWGNLTFAQIGEMLDISPNTAASRYRYGIEQLRNVARHSVARV